jgi:hypothetical protein
MIILLKENHNIVKISDTYDVSCQSWPSTTNPNLLADFGELSMGLYALKLTIGFKTMACPPTLLLISQPSNLTSQHLPERGFDTMWKASRGLPHWQAHDTPNIIKSHVLMISRSFFLLKSGILSISWGRS